MLLNSTCLNNQRGVTLLEIAISLSILAALLYGVSGALNTADNIEIYQENKNYLESVRKAITTYVQVNRYLPCPDTNGNGRENRRNSLQCTKDVGKLPYLDIGVEAQDAWGEVLKYAVNRRADNAARIVLPDESASYFNNTVSPFPFFNQNTPPFGSNGGAANLQVCSRTAISCVGSTPTDDVIEFSAIAVIVSFGKNGKQTWDAIENNSFNSLSAAEIENADSDLYYWKAIGLSGFEDSDSTKTFYDDQLFWLTGYDVKYAVQRSGGFFLPVNSPPP